MAAPKLDGERQDEQLNPGQQYYDREFNDIVANTEKSGTFSDKTGTEAAQGEDNIQKVQNSEQSAVAGWNDKTEPQSATPKIKMRKGPIIGIGGGSLIAIIIAFLGFTPPAFLLPNLSHNSFLTNDSNSSILERRFHRTLYEKFNSPGGPCDVKQVACRMKKIPKPFLASLEGKNITAINELGDKIDTKGGGYLDDSDPKNKIARWEYFDANGKKQSIPANKFYDTYKKNAFFRKNVKAVSNMRYLAYNGKSIFTKFFSKYGLKRNGGVANDPSLSENTIKDKLANYLKNSPDTSNDGARNTLRKRANTLFNRSLRRVERTKGDPIIAIGTVACLAINVPQFIAGTFRAIQLAQILVLVNDVVLSPAGMQQAGRVDAEKVSAIGNLLTERPVDEDGKVGKSALDSQILLSAIGVNKAKAGASRYAPGYSMITHPLVRGSAVMSSTTKQTCNFINSPQAYIASAGITATLSAMSGGAAAAIKSGLQAAGKAIIAFGGIELLINFVEQTGALNTIADAAFNLIKGEIPNYIEGARGEELGDALGTGLLAYYSQAGTATGAAPLTTDQVPGFAEEVAKIDNEYREEDIATLSPFDTSSPYTFLGSIMSRLSLYSTPGDPLRTSATILGNIIKAPFTKLISPVNAVENRVNLCSYASEFGLEEDVAVNPAGYPCTGIPSNYLNLSRDEVFNLVKDEIDLETGEPKDNGEIAAMLSDCADADLEGLSGCTIKSLPAVDEALTICAPDEEGGPVTCETRNISSDGFDAMKRAAQSIYLYDLRVEQILAGEDREEASVYSPSSPSSQDVVYMRPENVIDKGKGWSLADNTDYSATPCANFTEDMGIYKHPTKGFTIRKCKVYGAPVSSLVSKAVLDIIEDARDDGIDLVIDSSFRTYEEQQVIYNNSCRNTDCSASTEQPGNSEHERGLAIDFSLVNCRTEDTACYQWMQMNGIKYGFYNLSNSNIREPWHWSTSAR